MKTLVISSFDVEKVYFLGHLPQSPREFEAETGTSCGDWGGGGIMVSSWQEFGSLPKKSYLINNSINSAQTW